MRRVIVMQSVSLDGFMEGPGHDLSWHRVSEELHALMNDVVGGCSRLLSGRVTYELMTAYWPTADADPDAPEVVREFAAIWRAIPKVVYSRTLETVAEPGVTLRHEVDPDEVRAWLAESEGDVAVGGADLVRTFRRLDLVDEYRLNVHPILLGRGTPLFVEGDPRADLELVETRTFPGGVVHVRCARDAVEP